MDYGFYRNDAVRNMELQHSTTPVQLIDSNREMTAISTDMSYCRRLIVKHTSFTEHALFDIKYDF